MTHDLGLAWHIADRVAVMYLGRIVEQGTTAERLDDPRHSYTRALLSLVPEAAHREPQILTGEAPDPTRIPPGAASTPVAPSWPRARPRGSASRGVVAARTGGLAPVSRRRAPHGGTWTRVTRVHAARLAPAGGD